MKIDLAKANALIDEYIAELTNVDRIAHVGRSWLEFAFERHGLIADQRKLPVFDSHPLWYACLILTRRVREVSRLETKHMSTAPGRTTENTIRRLRKGNLRHTVTAPRLEAILEQNRS
jgi:hypothetical protein